MPQQNDDDAPLDETEWLHVAGLHVDAIARALYERVQVLTEQRNRLLWERERERIAAETVLDDECAGWVVAGDRVEARDVFGTWGKCDRGSGWRVALQFANGRVQYYEHDDWVADGRPYDDGVMIEVPVSCDPADEEGAL
jgi:hypothetical protein